MKHPLGIIHIIHLENCIDLKWVIDSADSSQLVVAKQCLWESLWYPPEAVSLSREDIMIKNENLGVGQVFSRRILKITEPITFAIIFKTIMSLSYNTGLRHSFNF